MKKWKKFRSFDAFHQFAKNTNDPEFLQKIECVKTYGSRLPSLVEKIKKHCQTDPKLADYVFTTVHKSKGLEWQSVILLDDFREIPGFLSTGLETSAEDEKNLLYVAMTRAKKYLAINSSILNLLCSVHHNFEKVRISDHDDNADTATASASVCVECKDSRRDDRNLFVLERPKTELNGEVKRVAGILCSICAGKFEQNISLAGNLLAQNFCYPDHTREALRFFTGPLEDKMVKARMLQDIQGDVLQIVLQM